MFNKFFKDLRSKFKHSKHKLFWEKVEKARIFPIKGYEMEIEPIMEQIDEEVPVYTPF